jgi:RecG-like helicase
MGIKPIWFARKIWENIDKIPEIFQEHLPIDFIKENNLLGIHETIRNIHFPENFDIINKARYRIFFDRTLKIQIISLLNKTLYEQ